MSLRRANLHGSLVSILALLASSTIAACSSKDAPAQPSADTGGASDGGDETLGETGDETAGETSDAPATGCAPGEKTGAAGKTDGLKSTTNVKFNVRTPAAYDPTAATPLVMVYAPAGGDPATTETFTKLTPDVLKRGWIVAYADHIASTSPAALKGVAGIPKLISDQWCIDQARIYITGHSDGGSVTSLIAIQSLVGAAAVGPSAAGVNGAYLAGQKCPAPIAVMVMHGKNDTLFPGYGKEAADWWQKCFKCTVGAPLANGCIPYTGCDGGVEVRYCETPFTHPQWPNMNADLLDFFDRFKLAK